ncbi:helix-turn-helix domain-containing protein [Slackia heliotrinireducens]|uniref:helix-turn-helix domain-containing protein n=1 Tax=Slackia heliotrinireducens TaxID=84110 RepID=UPI003314C6D7
MAEAPQFGAILRQAREDSGEDLNTVARRIRIRPDILERIEESDLDGMPPRGYSRNMINAYARYLGLNPTELVKMYLDAQYAHQIDKARANIRPSGFNMDTGRTMRERHELSNQVGVGAPASHSSSHVRRNESFEDLFPSYGETGGRLSSSGAGAYSGSSASTRSLDSAITSRGASSGLGSVHVGSYNGYGDGLSRRRSQSESSLTRTMERVPQNGRRSRRDNDLGEQPYSNTTWYANQQNGFDLRSKLPFILAAIIILLLVVVIAVVVQSSKAPVETDDQTTMNISGMPSSSTSTSDDKEADSEKDAAAEEEKAEEPAEVAPTETVIKLSIPEEETAYVEVYEGQTYSESNGESRTAAETFTGPYEQTFNVNTTLQIVTTNPDGVYLTQDDEQVSWEDYGSGVYGVTFRFEDVLKAWNEAHGITTAAAETTDAQSAESGEAAEGEAEQPVETTAEETAEASADESAEVA